MRRVGRGYTVGVAFACVLCTALGGWTGSANAAAGDGAQVQVTFQGSGTYQVDQSYSAGGGSCDTQDTMALTWQSTFQATLGQNGLQGATGQLASAIGPGTLNFSDSGQGCQNAVPPCQATLTSASGAQPLLKVSGTDPQRVEAESEPGPLTTSLCSATEGPFIGRDLSFLNQALPDALTSVTDIPATQLADGYSANVDQSSAPGQITSNCTGQGPDASANTGCAASLSWTGAITIACKPGTVIGKVTYSSGSALPVGTQVCDGQFVKTGDRSRVEITFNDRSASRLGPNSEASFSSSDGLHDEGGNVSVKLVLGTLWANVVKLAQGDDALKVTTDRAVAGNRGSQSTLSIDPRTGALSLHDIEGHGFVQVPGKPVQNFGPGYTAIVNGSSAQITTAWPADQRVAVPSGATPPSIGALKLTVGKHGRGAQLGFTLDQPASAKLQILRGRRVVATVRSGGHAGYSLLAVRKRLRRGKYVAVLTATNASRVSVVKLTFRER